MLEYSDTSDTGNGTESSVFIYYRATSDLGNAAESSVSIYYRATSDPSEGTDSNLVIVYLTHIGADVATAVDLPDADISSGTVDVAVASDTDTSKATVSATMISSGVGTDVAGISLVVVSTSDSAAGDDSTRLLAIVSFTDSVTGNDSVLVWAGVLTSDIAYVGDSTVSSTDLFTETLDSGYGFDLCSFVETVGLAYTINSDSGAVGMYALPVRVAGVAELGGVLYFASESGLYAMDAETDLGAAIAWRIKTGMSMFGQERLKRLRDINILGRTSGAVHLRVISARSGEKRSDTFIKAFPSSSAQRGGVIKVGRGLSSVYWGLELEGRAFAEIDALSLLFDPLSRRY